MQITVDARGLLCPMPVIRLQDKVAELSPQDEVQIVCTDPGVLSDIPAWCRINGHEVIKTAESAMEITLWVRVG